MQAFTLTREQSVGAGTRSVLDGAINGHICDALELAFHDPKIAGKTRIPAGTYPLRFHQSPKFDAVYSKRVNNAGLSYKGMIQICNVPGFDDVLFHCGNSVADSEGCVLLGLRICTGVAELYIPGGESEPAFIAAYRLMSPAMGAGGAQLIVKDADRP